MNTLLLLLIIAIIPVEIAMVNKAGKKKSNLFIVVFAIQLIATTTLVLLNS